MIDGASRRVWNLQSDNPVLHMIQQIRDEAHRFALTGHKARRDKARKLSKLDGVSGIGPKRKRDLLRHFGSAAGVQNASMEELRKVKGINEAVAQRIYDHFKDR